MVKGPQLPIVWSRNVTSHERNSTDVALFEKSGTSKDLGSLLPGEVRVRGYEYSRLMI